MAKKIYNVIGLWDNTGRVFQERVAAHDAFQAMRLAVKNIGEADELCILGAFSGNRGIITPGCDNDMSTYASDLQEHGEEE